MILEFHGTLLQQSFSQLFKGIHSKVYLSLKAGTFSSSNVFSREFFTVMRVMESADDYTATPASYYNASQTAWTKTVSPL